MNFETFEDLCNKCKQIAQCDPAAVDGFTSIAKAALALQCNDAHLSAMLDLVSFFAEGGVRKFFEAQQQKVHVYGICTMLFIQFFGRHLYDASAQDHWPLFQGAGLDASAEQVELIKSTPSRSRPSSSKTGSGPTKAHKLHVKHVIKQFRAFEKRLAAFLTKHTLHFLDLLRTIGAKGEVDGDVLACVSLLLENADGLPFSVDDLPHKAGVLDTAKCAACLTEHLQLAAYAANAAFAIAHDDAGKDGEGAAHASASESSLDTDSPRTVLARPGVGRTWHPEDVIGSCRTTILRGESDVTRDALHIVGCHEASVYVLAPTKHVFISCCNDCIVVVGAAGASLRVEHCERMHIVAAAVRLTIATCHDCMFNVAVNTQPLLAGDNRFAQLAPFNAAYEHLPRHLREAGVARAPDRWDSPLELARDPYQLRSGRGSSPASESGATCPVFLMPPEEFLPFMVPFKGGPGPLCGGACTETFQWSPDAAAAQGYPSAHLDVFPLPKQYADALEEKIKRVAHMRAAVKTSFLDHQCKQEVQAVIQAYFKDWLMTSNNIRQVYDLARLEREHAKTHMKRGKSRSDAGDGGDSAGSRRSSSKEQ